MSTEWVSKIDPDLVADEVVHRLHVELWARPSWTLVMIASSAARWSVSAEEPLRLVEQAGVLEGHAEARDERRQEADVGLGEGVDAVEVLERDPTADFARPRSSGAKQDGLGRLALDHLDGLARLRIATPRRR